MSKNSLVLLLLASWLIAGAVHAQTTVIVFGTADSVLVGADSKRHFQRTTTSENKSTCKILVYDNRIVYAMVGMTGFTLSGDSVEYKPMISELLQHYEGIGFLAQVDSVSNVMHGQIQDDLKRIMREDPDLYASYISNKDGLPLAALLFVTAESTGPISAIRNYEFDGDTGTLGNEALNCNACPYLSAVLGANSAIGAWMDEHRYAPTVNTINFLIHLQANETPDKVAPPVDIIRVGRGGPLWRQVKRECRAF